MRPWVILLVFVLLASVGYRLTRQVTNGPTITPDSKINEISQCILREFFELAPWRDKSVYSSQYGQDAWIHETFSDVLPRHGYFLEFGARDGVEDSNTFFFDRSLGYTGVLIEAVPDEYDKACENRKRYGVSVHHGLACGKDDVQRSKSFVYDADLKGLGMLAEGKKEEKIEKLEILASQRNQVPRITEMELPCIDVQKQVMADGIDSLVIMSVDCEGCELAVLKDFDFGLTPVSIILVEINDDIEDIMKLLIPSGFIPVNARTSDLILVHRKFLAGSNAAAQYQNIMSLPAEDICHVLNWVPELMWL